jgi:hypothetical protein
LSDVHITFWHYYPITALFILFTSLPFPDTSKKKFFGLENWLLAHGFLFRPKFSI